MLSIVIFIVGIILYSFAEYAIHRWILHGPMIKQHAVHHRDPSKNIHVPFMVMIPALLLVLLVAGFPLMLGILSCWIGSSLLHRRLHVGKPSSPQILRLWHRHNGHHRKVTTNYGVTSMFWDALFGTLGKNDLT